MSLSQPLAPEVLRSRVTVECENCHAQNRVEKLFSERPSDLEPGLVESISTCPDCGHIAHAYWVSPYLRAQRNQIFGLIAVLARRRTPLNFQRVKDLKEKYKNLFDIEQAKYREMANGRTP